MKHFLNVILSLTFATAGWFVTNSCMQIVTLYSLSDYDDAVELVQTISRNNLLWALFDLVMRMCVCGMAGLIVLRGPVRFCGTRLVIVGWTMSVLGLIEAATVPSGATAQFVGFMLWLVPVSTFLGGLMAIRERLQFIDAMRREKSRS